jgi:hypothetical protein
MHDWILEGIHIYWKERKVHIIIGGIPDHRRVIVVSEFNELVVPRYDEWGPSESINDTQVSKKGDFYQIDIEMQTGDTIKIIGKTMKEMMRGDT